MAVTNEIQKIRDILISAAKHKGVVQYPAIYNVFAKGTPDPEIWNTFEEACRTICDSTTAIYGALLSIKSTGLPKSGFFDIYKNIRGSHYRSFAGSSEANTLSVGNQTLFCTEERARVYAHAATIP